MFSKRLADLDADDIRSVIGRRVQEDTVVELKGALATRDGTPDPWYGDQRRIGNEAKRDLAKELVAFANAEGGTLVLGIHEDGDKRADRIQAIPACRALADRLAASIAASTDPRLTSIEYVGVETDLDGSGVVVLRVPQSHRAPHRDTDSKECYVRVGDRSEPMAMRQIQDLTIQRSAGLKRLRETLDARSRAFEIMIPNEIEQLGANGPHVLLKGCGVRASAIPLEDVYIDAIQRDRRFHIQAPDLLITDARGNRERRSSGEHLVWRPMLRGIRALNAPVDRRLRSDWIIGSDGLIEHSFQTREWAQGTVVPTPRGMPAWWILRTFVHTIISAEAFRRRMGRPDLPFSLDFEWKLPGGAHVLTDGNVHWERELVPMEEVSRVESYVMPETDGLPELFERLHADLGWSCGVEFPYVKTLDFAHAIESAMRG